MRTIQIAFTGIAATANAIAQVVIPSRSKLKQVEWAVHDENTGTDGMVMLQLSKASATEIGVNGAQQVISNLHLEKDFVTSGLCQGAVNFIHAVDVELDQGQIVYVHADVIGLTVTGHILLHLT